MVILLVDDDPGFLDRLRRALEARGRTTVGCRSAADAVSRGSDPSIGGAVVDLRLAENDGRDGLWVVRELRAIRPDLAVVVLTGFGSIATALEAVRLGARDYLTKPADPDHVLSALRGERAHRVNPKEIPPDMPSLDRVEWEYIERVLAESNGNISQAARLLGLDRRTLQRKLAKFPPRR